MDKFGQTAGKMPKTSKKTGRPPKDRSWKDNLSRLLKKYQGNVSELCRSQGISRELFYTEVRRDPRLNRILKTRDEKIVKKVFLDIMADSYGTVTEACQMFGIPRSTYYYWIQNDPAFSDTVMEINEITKDRVESKLHQGIDEGDPSLIKYYLSRKARDRGYEDYQELKHRFVEGTTFEVTYENRTKDLDDGNSDAEA